MPQQTANLLAGRAAHRLQPDTSLGSYTGDRALTPGHSGCANEEVPMNIRQTRPQGIDDLAAIAVRLGRELGQMAAATSLGGGNNENGFVSRTLRQVAARDPFDPRDDSSLEALRGIIAADLSSEERGSEWQLVETHCDADGPHYEPRACVLYSERGESLLRVQRTFERFLSARNATLDRVAAERALLRLMST